MEMEQAYTALRNAHAAGDTASAQKLAAWIQGQQRAPLAPLTADPTEGMSGAQRFMAGVGKAMTDVGRGVRQYLPESIGGLSDADIAQARKYDAPLMNTTAGTLGNIAGNVAMLAPTAAIPGANTVTGAGLIGALTGAIQPGVDTYERFANTAMGGIGGASVQKGVQSIGRVLGGAQNAKMAQDVSIGKGSAKSSANVTGTPQVNVSGGGAGFGTVDPTDVGGLTQSQDKLLKWAQERGFKVTPGQATGSRSLQQLEAKLESQPMTSGKFNAIKEQNQTKLNEIVANALGEKSNAVDFNVLGKAHDRIGGVYKMVANDKANPIDPDLFLDKLGNIENEFEGLLPTSIVDNPLVKRYVSYAEKGEATNRQLQDLASKLNKAAYNQMTSANGDRQVGMALGQVKDLVDDELQKGLSGSTLDAFKKARAEYRTLMTVMKPGVVNPSTGNVSGATLANVLQRTDRTGYSFGKTGNDLYNAARFAQAFKPIVGDSGTATRSMITNPIEAVASIPFSLATHAYASSPSVALAQKMQRGVAPQMFTPGALNAIQNTARTGLLGAAYGLE